MADRHPEGGERAAKRAKVEAEAAPKSTAGRPAVVILDADAGKTVLFMKQAKVDEGSTLVDLPLLADSDGRRKTSVIADTVPSSYRNGFKNTDHDEHTKEMQAFMILATLDYHPEDFAEPGPGEEDKKPIHASMRPAFRKAKAFMDEWLVNAMEPGVTPEDEVDYVPLFGSPLLVLHKEQID